LFYKGESPLILIILFSVLMGGIITAAAGSIKMFRLKRQNKKLYNDLQVLRDVLKKHQLLDEINNEDIDSIDYYHLIANTCLLMYNVSWTYRSRTLCLLYSK